MTKIAFIGSANALGMMYALELRNIGHDVQYFVTTPYSDTLSRPECHYSEITYPYDYWIIERVVHNPLRANLLPRRYIGDIINELDKSDLVILSGMYLMLASHLHSKKIAFLSHGSDLDVWCNKLNYKNHAAGLLNPKSFIGSLASIFGTQKMRRSFRKCGLLITFPVGLSPERDDVVLDLIKNWGGDIIYRFDVSFRPLIGVSRDPPFRSDKLVLLCAVRSSFVSTPGSSPSDLKGVDIILRGVSKYISLNRMPIELHITEKGKDISLAKEICRNNHIDNYVIWHKEMPFRELINLYKISDICFDQVSSSWLGAIGCYALYLGRPLIARSRHDIFGTLWGSHSPVCESSSINDVCDWLVKLENIDTRKEISELSRKFADNCLGSSHVLKEIIKFLG
jgi:hypothetical protein